MIANLIISLGFLSIISATAGSPTSSGRIDANCTDTDFLGDLNKGLKAFEFCVDKLKITNMPSFNGSNEELDKYYESVAKKDFDDKCLMKCFADQFNLLTPEGTIIKDKLTSFIKNDQTKTNKAIEEAVTKVWTICMEKMETEASNSKSTKDVNDSALCKRLSALDHCLYQHWKEMCH